MIDINKIKDIETPFYLYDMGLLEATLREIHANIDGKPVCVHYAIKANGNPRILKLVAESGLGADCVSGGEIEAAVATGFPADKIYYAGVGKTVREIRQAIQTGIGCFNVESLEELEILAEIAAELGKKAPVALRINPDIDAHTHHYITTGLEENKFGIDLRLLDKAVDLTLSYPSLNLIGLHFHIGSQITTMEPYRILGERINRINETLQGKGVEIRIINVGGGLGIDYDDPDANPIPDFKDYFDTLTRSIMLKPGQQIHCELGRSIVAQCGSLISRVIYVKEGVGRRFMILDAGMSDLIRPALYGAHHLIQNLTPADSVKETLYDVVGPICESSDTFGKDEKLPEARRGDIVAIRSAGAYGESMASTYNMRRLAPAVFID